MPTQILMTMQVVYSYEKRGTRFIKRRFKLRQNSKKMPELIHSHENCLQVTRIIKLLGVRSTKAVLYIIVLYKTFNSNKTEMQ